MARKLFVVIVMAIIMLVLTQSSEAAQPTKKSVIYIVQKNKITYGQTWAIGFISCGSEFDVCGFGEKRPDFYVFFKKGQNWRGSWHGPCAGTITKRTIIRAQTLDRRPIKRDNAVLFNGNFAFVYGKLKIVPGCIGKGTEQYWEEINIILLPPPTLPHD